MGIQFHQVLETFLNSLGDCQVRLGQNYEIVYFRINLIVSIETLIETGLLLTKESIASRSAILEILAYTLYHSVHFWNFLSKNYFSCKKQ